jgi:hypothetical protein
MPAAICQQASEGIHRAGNEPIFYVGCLKGRVRGFVAHDYSTEGAAPLILATVAGAASRSTLKGSWRRTRVDRPIGKIEQPGSVVLEAGEPAFLASTDR